MDEFLLHFWWFSAKINERGDGHETIYDFNSAFLPVYYSSRLLFLRHQRIQAGQILKVDITIGPLESTTTTTGTLPTITTIWMGMES